ncbi:hypothetical protein R2362_02970 [Mycobacteroides chelonae]|nr:hypothetical protein [Mycobacteroides chelonae]
MSNALLPCFKCGKTLENAIPGEVNQPSEGTEFRTVGHYGSTFWDSFDGTDLVLNVCDDCLGHNVGRLATQGRPVTRTEYAAIRPFEELER